MDFGDLEKILFPPMTGWLLAAKIFFILFNLGVVLFIIYVWSTTMYLKRLFWWDLKEFLTWRAYNVRVIDKDWRNIKKRLLTKKPIEFRQAIIEADLLVDDVLTRDGYEGKTLKEKLEKRSKDFLSIDGMEEADHLYQKIIADPQYHPEYQEAKTAILAFEQGLKSIHAFLEKL